MYLHGCFGTVDGMYYELESLERVRMIEYAASNDIILIMPQAEFNLFINPTECFDFLNVNTWWNETQYITKNGHQM